MNDPIVADILNNEVALDKKCWNCNGVKNEDPNANFWTDGVCDMCNNSGYRLTDAGQAIINLVKRHTEPRPPPGFSSKV